jgi:hypothetical protein
MLIPAVCENCDRGFRRIDGIHIGSQRLGMIPNTPCKRVGAITDPEAAPRRRFVPHVDGAPLRKKDGEIRRFATATAAVNAARKAAPRQWHP